MDFRVCLARDRTMPRRPTKRLLSLTEPHRSKQKEDSEREGKRRNTLGDIFWFPVLLLYASRAYIQVYMYMCKRTWVLLNSGLCSSDKQHYCLLNCKDSARLSSKQCVGGYRFFLLQ